MTIHQCFILVVNLYRKDKMSHHHTYLTIKTLEYLDILYLDVAKEYVIQPSCFHYAPETCLFSLG